LPFAASAHLASFLLFARTLIEYVLMRRIIDFMCSAVFSARFISPLKIAARLNGYFIFQLAE